jgi:hypothetical protein
MKRIIMMLALAALLVVALAMSAFSAFAGPTNVCDQHPEKCGEENPCGQQQGCNGGNPNCTVIRTQGGPNN